MRESVHCSHSTMGSDGITMSAHDFQFGGISMNMLLSFLKLGIFGSLINGKKATIVITYLYYGGLLTLFSVFVYQVWHRRRSAWITFLAIILVYGAIGFGASAVTAVIFLIIYLIISPGNPGKKRDSMRGEETLEESLRDYQLEQLRITIAQIKDRYRDGQENSSHNFDATNDPHLSGVGYTVDFNELDSIYFNACYDDSLDSNEIYRIQSRLRAEYGL